MKSIFLSVIALLGIFSAVASSAPGPVPLAKAKTEAIEQRQEADAFAILEDLYSTIQGSTGSINSTAASIGPDTGLIENGTAVVSFNDAISSITSAIDAATDEISVLGAAKRQRGLEARQSIPELANLIFNIIVEINSSLNNIIDLFGLGSIIPSIGPLTMALSRLLSALADVVYEVLELVQQLLNNLLNGLSDALAGLDLPF
ncbi:hypothetical protein BDY21DRAFT_352543 [Lineolata rhizophorae]|uniref:Hydrophobic surface binding protein A-domain-containing protein n=1 Tax=Lineolata rhizophorae TaxID=578093 RepID=A0A6A6NSF8_9PEZI|nr:hypothetical protein BDY21DRAFT_352543 [Lineolata rhizophorae]